MLKAGDYQLEPIEEPVSQARKFFGPLEGKLVTRKIDLNKVDPNRIVDLEERPEYSPTISLFQYKRKDEGDYVYFQEIFVHDVFLNSLEKFLRSKAIDVPGGPDGRYAHPDFVHYYETPFALIACDIKRDNLTKMSPAGKFKVIENLGSVDVFQGVDFKAGSILRMIEPQLMEEKLREIEQEAAYIVSIKQHHLNDASLMFYEYKPIGIKDHFILKKR